MTGLMQNMVDYAKRWLAEEDEITYATDNDAMIQAIEKARQDWMIAKSYFNNATDPDLVDHAIYSIEAAEKKYMYLLKQARQQGLRRPQLVDTDWAWPS